MKYDIEEIFGHLLRNLPINGFDKKIKIKNFGGGKYGYIQVPRTRGVIRC